MAQQVVYGIIPEYPSKTPDKDSKTWVFSDQCTSTSGTSVGTMQMFTGLCVIATVTLVNDLMANSTMTVVLPKTLTSIDHILDSQGKTLQLAKPISVDITYQENMYCCQNEELGIITMSTKLDDCVKDFQDEILFVWNEYGKENDDKLTKDAIELKRRIHQYIKK